MPASYCQPCACNDAKKRVADIQKAKKNLPFAKAAYTPVPTIEKDGKTFRNISDDPKALAELGLEPEDLTIPGTAFRTVVYKSGADVVVAFKGTDPTALSDLKADVVQGLGVESEYYTRAQSIAQKMDVYRSGLNESRNPPLFVGHSLGGGLASAAAAATKDGAAPAMTYNAAGLHARNVGEAVAKDVTAVKVRGEFLTGYINKSRVAPDVFASDEVLIDPKPGFGRDVVLPVLGSLLGGVGLVGALAVRSLMLHLNDAISDSLEYEEGRAAEAQAEKCGGGGSSGSW